MSARWRLTVGILLLLAALAVATTGRPLSGTTLAALLLAFAALAVLAPVLDPPASRVRRVSIDEAVAILEREERWRRHAAAQQRRAADRRQL